MFKTASAWSNGSSAEQVAVDCIAQVERSGLEQPHFVVLHANCALPLRDIGCMLARRWPGVRLHAATSCLGAMTESAVAMTPGAGVGLLALQDAKGEYGTAAGDFAGGPQEAGRRLARRALDDAGRSGEVPPLVLVCATPGNEEEFLEGVQSVVGTGALIVGGSAADNDISGQWQVFDQARDMGWSQGAVVSVLFPSVSVSTAFESGYSPSEHRGVITKSKGRRVLEIAGEPAARTYERWTGGEVSQPSTGRANVLMATALAPLGRVAAMLGGTPLYALSHPETLSADGSMTLFTAVAEGEELVLMKGTSATLVSQAGSVVRSARRIGDLDGRGVSAVLLYYCGGCMLKVVDALQDVRRSLAEEVPGVPSLVGFTFGEQGSLLSGPVRHGNLMVSAIVFGKQA